MNKKFIRITALILCAVMILGMVPLLARAEDGLIKLGTPADLKWGYRAVWAPDPETGEGTWSLEAGHPGYASWEVTAPVPARYDLNFYQITDKEVIRVDGTSWSFDAAEEEKYCSAYCFELSDPESGTYYFTVTALSDNMTYTDSNTAVSDVWYYEKPAARLDPCTNVRFDDSYHVTWDGPAEREYLYGYQMEWFYSPSESEEPHILRWFWYGFDAPETTLPDDVFQDPGDGYYYFRVRALSKDITKYCNSDWTELTLAYHIAEDEPDVSGDLDHNGVIDDSDVEQLLWHTLFPENYKIHGSADFNHDGAVNDSDVAYLLWHTLFPENYPLT